uniref:Uncharacterized protein n=2 Tax=Hemiselmis andersenii TaxID=464988 RepID=A0A6U4U5P7_HEMAN|mmetsp:Transcript_16637/g.38368  ORF Transcript_16637/g.38368 Transcript_16637/m.38368 type:complete len:329 (+) Transcript_16637:420-1406(+)|eukprot:CAMPEP_0169450366 /NCGR_PEP_ID=MMETSP1042-20121227/13116_1 /TAXON_ID=464988 /ORGANISM="Hemiselmis andersenii, Strain CCMP1180" /LENGTH=328 /DNA_ID=CAMNT_0009562187 /DNA_START=400 /DNA_END=1386 /DNA_ORIENTATION=-
MSHHKSHSHKRIYPDVHAHDHQTIPKTLSMGAKPQSKKAEFQLRNQLRHEHVAHNTPSRGRPPAYDQGPAAHGASKHAAHGSGSKRSNEIPAALLPKKDTQSEWGTGLLSCCCTAPTSGCCFDFLCPCITYGTNVETLDAQKGCCRSADESKDVALCGGSKYLACCSWMLLEGCLLGCIMHSGARRAIRYKYGIHNGWCPDVAVTFLCPLCAIHQEALEFKRRNNPTGAFTDTTADASNADPNNQTTIETLVRACFSGLLCVQCFRCGGYMTSTVSEVSSACRNIWCPPDTPCCESCGESCSDGCETCRHECLTQVFGDVFGSKLSGG